MNKQNTRLKQSIRISFLIISLLCGGFIIYEYIFIGYGMLAFLLSIPFLIAGGIASFIQTKRPIPYVHKRLSGFVVWVVSVAIIFGSIFLIHQLRNSSPILFSTKFYWEEGVDVQFRENGTFKALNHNMMGGEINFGKYKIIDSLIILEDKLKFGKSNMNDTLIVSKDGIDFKLEKKYRITEGRMSFDNQQKTKVKIQNNTNTTIDAFSIKQSYTNYISNTISIKSNQEFDYPFEMNNSITKGHYILSFRKNSQSSEIQEYRDILDGYPLEVVESIQFKNEGIVIRLIFGNEVSITYK